jgi:hypothetical protein
MRTCKWCMNKTQQVCEGIANSKSCETMYMYVNIHETNLCLHHRSVVITSQKSCQKVQPLAYTWFNMNTVVCVYYAHTKKAHNCRYRGLHVG